MVISGRLIVHAPVQDELDVANVQLVELRTKHELVEARLAVCKQAEVESTTANSELSARISDEQERATQLEGARARVSRPSVI